MRRPRNLLRLAENDRGGLRTTERSREARRPHSEAQRGQTKPNQLRLAGKMRGAAEGQWYSHGGRARRAKVVETLVLLNNQSPPLVVMFLVMLNQSFLSLSHVC